MASDNQQLKKKFWKVFSEYVRKESADKYGMVQCVTCPNRSHWQEMDAGHYHPRTDGLSLYFDEKNVHPQCTACNRFRHGNLTQYALYLRERYGEQILEELEWKHRQFIKITNKEYEDFIKLYKEKIKNLPISEVFAEYSSS